jgi:transcriptional regulator with XRE-family HTH domain
MTCIELQANCGVNWAYNPGVLALARFGDNLKRLMKDAGINGVRLAKLVEVTPPVVSGWRGNRNGLPEAPTLLKLAKALRCSIDDLLDGVDPAYDAIRLRAATLRQLELTADEREVLNRFPRAVERYIRRAVNTASRSAIEAVTAARVPAGASRSGPKLAVSGRNRTISLVTVHRGKPAKSRGSSRK